MVVRDLMPALRAAARSFPCLTITGPRQSGKSTLCKAAFPRLAHANLEAPDVRSFALQDPRGFLNQFPRGAILDEIQRCPELSSYLQERIDADPRPGRWVLTGSQNLALMSSVSQSLAGRTAILHLLPLAYPEVCRFRSPPRTLDEVLFAGGYPRIFDQRIQPREWLGSYVSTYLERDVRSLLRVGDLTAFQRFLGLCAGRTAQLLNLSALASDCGVSQPTAAAWVSVLEASFIVFRLPYYSRGIKKRLVKMPKLHFHDTGLVCWLLGIQAPEQLASHPLRGAIFETWVVSEILKHRLNRGVANGLSYYRDAHGLEADLLVDEGSTAIVVEAKAGQTVDQGMFASALRVCSAVSTSGCVARPFLAYGGATRQARADVTVVPWQKLHQEPWGIVKAVRGRTAKRPRQRQGKNRP
jgi:hypothetical protein